MPSEPSWLPLEEIIETNHKAVDLTGEPFFIRDHALLEMGWMRPINLLRYGDGVVDLASLAVALLLGIGRCHPFEQGNKRTALAAAILFLKINGYDFVGENSERFAEVIIAVIEDRLSEAYLIDIFREGIVELRSM